MMEFEEWIKGLLSVVSEIADKDFQERVWWRGEGPEVSSWEEMLCKFFDDYDVDNFVENYMGTAGLSEKRQHALRELRDALSSYSDRLGNSYSIQNILADPNWHMIRDGIAKETLKCFRET